MLKAKKRKAAKRVTAPSKSPSSREDVFAALRALMLRRAKGMKVVRDADGQLTLLAPWANPLKPKQPMMFGFLRAGKAYVSYHLMPLYVSAALNDKIPKNLLPRMQGKTCFNFKTLDSKQAADLGKLTAACAKAFAKPFAFPGKYIRD
jgi:hypothetical protein